MPKFSVVRLSGSESREPYRILETYETSDGVRTRVCDGQYRSELEADDEMSVRVDAYKDSKTKFEEVEKQLIHLSHAYLRLRNLIPGAFDTPYAPSSEQVWETTECALKKALGNADLTALISFLKARGIMK